LAPLTEERSRGREPLNSLIEPIDHVDVSARTNRDGGRVIKLAIGNAAATPFAQLHSRAGESDHLLVDPRGDVDIARDWRHSNVIKVAVWQVGIIDQHCAR